MWSTASHLNCTKTPASFQSATEKIKSGDGSQLLRDPEIRKGKSLMQHYLSLLYTLPAQHILFEDISLSGMAPCLYIKCIAFSSLMCNLSAQITSGLRLKPILLIYIFLQKSSNLAHLVISTNQLLAVQTSCISHLTVIQLQLQVWVQSKKFFFPANMNLIPLSGSLKPLPYVKDPIKNILDWGTLVKIDRTAVWVKISGTTHTRSFGFSFYHNTEIGTILRTEAL